MNYADHLLSCVIGLRRKCLREFLLELVVVVVYLMPRINLHILTLAAGSNNSACLFTRFASWLVTCFRDRRHLEFGRHLESS